jgi:ribose transport system substrate-binding protein
MPERVRHGYLVDAVVRAQKVVEAFGQHSEALRLRDVVERTGLGKNLCFRLLYTLRHCGVVEKVDVNRYRLVSGDQRRRRYRIGYADQVVKDGWLRVVNAGLVRAAEQANIELIQVSNRNDPKVAVRNARLLVRQNPDLVIEFQIDESAAPAVAAQYVEAGIPAIAVDIPHPGATFFGANNYHAGLLGGRHLGRWVRSQWRTAPDEIILIGQPRAGSVVASRVHGVLAGIHEILPDLAGSCPVVELDGDGQYKIAIDRVRRHLRGSKAKKVLVGCVNDASALAAVRAFQEAGRADCCAVVGQNAEPDARTELRTERTPLVASVGYFPERYGDALIRLALDILGGKAVPPAVFIKHQVITRENVDHYYPNDALLREAPSY